jgi:hypothetical protein
MKNYFNFFLLLFAIGFSQNAPISFESGENGSTWSFAVLKTVVD